MTLEKELDESQQKLNETTLKFATQKTDSEKVSFAHNELNNSGEDSPIYDRLLFWRNKLQNPKQNHFNKIKIKDEKDDYKAQCSKQGSIEFEKIETEKEFRAKIENVEKQLKEIRTKIAVQEKAIKIEKRHHERFLEKGKTQTSLFIKKERNRIIKKERNRNFRTEAENHKKLAEKELENQKKTPGK